MRAQRGQLAVLELAAPVVLDLLRTVVHQQPVGCRKLARVRDLRRFCHDRQSLTWRAASSEVVYEFFAGERRGVWVPRTRSRHATWTCSCKGRRADLVAAVGWLRRSGGGVGSPGGR